MIKEANVVAECYIDTEMVRFIRNGRYPRHGEGNSGVSKLMENERQILVGIVDNDKRFTPYLKQFKELKRLNGLSLRKHPKYDQHLIVVGEKDAEEWLEEQVSKCQKSLQDFGFHNFQHFEKITKNSGTNANVSNLLNTLKQKKAPGFNTMNEWIDDILKKEKPKPKKR